MKPKALKVFHLSSGTMAVFKPFNMFSDQPKLRKRFEVSYLNTVGKRHHVVKVTFHFKDSALRCAEVFGGRVRPL